MAAMCSYCGCEAEPLIKALSEDHGVIADLAYRAAQALEEGDLESGAATQELERLLADHRRLRPLLQRPDLATRPERMHTALVALAQHAEIEDNDLFPYAVQHLPSAAWDRINSRS